METKRNRGRIRPIRLCLLVLCLILFFSCAPSIQHYPRINQHLITQDYDSAYKLVKENKKAYAKRNAVLYYLDEGIIAHFAGYYQDSNGSLSKAESIMQELYTKSLSKEAASFLISDLTIPYRGEDFEMAMVNLFMALNYVRLGKWEDALVEARKVDNKLMVINSQHEEEKKNVYKEDAFIRFLMGALYEAEGEINDAFISYRKAEDIYRNDYLPNYGVRSPSFLIENLLTSGRSMGFYHEVEEIQSEYPGVQSISFADKMELAEVFFVHYNGLGPVKAEEHFLVPMPDKFVVKIAYPKFEKRSYQISHGEITLRNQGAGEVYQFPTVLMEDIGSIAVTNLENRINRIKAKAIARATTKYLASKGAEKVAKEHGGELLSLIVKASANVASTATEQADCRQWRLLPAEIRVGRAVIPPGEYSGKIEFVDSYGAVLSSRAIEPFSVKKTEKKFFVFRTLR